VATHETIQDYFHAIAQASLNLHPGGHKGTNGNGASGKKHVQYVNEMTGEFLGEEETIAVDSLRAKPKKKFDKKRSDKSVLQCTHCDKRGHTYDVCFKRLGSGRYGKPSGANGVVASHEREQVQAIAKTEPFLASGNEYSNW
jgi:hypothetical protein